MKTITSITLALLNLAGGAVFAAEIPPGASLVSTVQWQPEKLPAGGKWTAGGPEGGGYVSISNAEKKPVSVSLWESKQPGIQTKWYAVQGKLRSRAVEGVGYLDLWSSFAGSTAGEKTRYFSRTLAARGPLQQITGTSDWRTVLLPFDGTQAQTPPAGLELNLVLAGAGTVELTDLQILQFADASSMWAAIGSGAEASSSALRMRWTVGLVSGVGLLAASGGVIALVVVLKGRKRAELRKMRALDLG